MTAVELPAAAAPAAIRTVPLLVAHIRPECRWWSRCSTARSPGSCARTVLDASRVAGERLAVLATA